MGTTLKASVGLASILALAAAATLIVTSSGAAGRTAAPGSIAVPAITGR
jgi:hypothetical protein